MNKLWWFWLPAGFLGFQAVIETVLSPAVLSRLHTENGPHELIEFALIAAACAVAFLTLFRVGKKKNKWMTAWLGLAAFCCFYVAGEEISWGQHFMAWSTPELWSAVNDQQETNLHNTTSWLDQKPRLLLELGVLTGGLILPLLMKYRPALVPARFAAIYPPPYFAFVALLALGVKLADIIADLAGIRLFERGSEVEELYLYYFVLLYLLDLRRRIQ